MSRYLVGGFYRRMVLSATIDGPNASRSYSVDTDRLCDICTRRKISRSAKRTPPSELPNAPNSKVVKLRLAFRSPPPSTSEDVALYPAVY